MRKTVFFQICLALAITANLSFLTTSADAVQDGADMTIGSKAPDLDIEFWVSDNDGEFEHVTKLQEGRVYVIEFWATWCGPCIAQMPHLAETQKKYASQGVQLISVSDEDLETVEGFLDREIRGDEEGRTYGELTSTYCLTADPDKSVLNDYFVAAGKTGIPCAFIVGKTGVVEWIGHPGEMNMPLKQVVNDEWDREAFLVAYKKEQEAREKAAKQRQMLAESMQSVQELMQTGEEGKAIKKLTEMVNDKEFEFAKGPLSSMRLQLMITTGHDEAASALSEFTAQFKSNSMALNEVAWGIYERHEAVGDVSKDVLAAAKATAEAAVKAEPESGAILDTLAHLIYVVDGDLDKAIEVQKQAVAKAGVQEAEIRPFLDQLLEEKKTGKKSKKKKRKTLGTDF